MRTIARKQKVSRKSGPGLTTTPRRTAFGQRRAVSAVHQQQPTTGSHDVQLLPQVASEELDVNPAGLAFPRFAHDFTRIPVYPKAGMNDIRLIADSGTAGNASPLPHLKRIQQSFGSQHDLGEVKAYVGGQAAKAARDLGAEAYTSDDRVAFRAAPNLHTAAHEAAHVVQQRSGALVSGGFGTKGDAYERQADAVADSVIAGHSSENLLSPYAGASGNKQLTSPTIQYLGQDLPYVGPLLSYLNPRNQLVRAFLPGLSRSRKALLDGIFGNSLATSLIRLNPNSILAAGSCYRTTGNIINMPGTTIDDSHLIHEAAHVWQSQNTLFGVGYAVSALRAMAIAEIIGGDWQRAYDYSNVERLRIPWCYWNAEQQAHWIQDHRRLPSGWMLAGQLPVLGAGVGVESAGIE